MGEMTFEFKFLDEFKLFGEFKFIFENYLEYQSGDQELACDKKKMEVENLVQVYL
jgi:hypothetical protein